MTQTTNNKQKRFDLEDRTLHFSKCVLQYSKNMPKFIGNIEIAKQLVRAAGSIGANYIEANEALSRKDFIMRIKICRKESKECCYWLKLSEFPDLSLKNSLIQETSELASIFGAILETCKKSL